MAEETSFAVFDTAIGWCGIAWSDKGIAGVQLPAADEEATRTRMRRKCHSASDATPPATVQHTIDGIVALLGGKAIDFAGVMLDMDGVPEFHRRVYDVARTIRAGRTMTYGEIATALDAPGTAQTVGYALGRNPFPIIVPCHRVLAAGGKPGGFSAPGGVQTKVRMLAIEGVKVQTGDRRPETGTTTPEQLELGVLNAPLR